MPNPRILSQGSVNSKRVNENSKQFVNPYPNKKFELNRLAPEENAANLGLNAVTLVWLVSI